MHITIGIIMLVEEDMETKARNEIVKKAFKAVEPVAQKEEKRIKSAIENIAIITTMITIGAYATS